MVVVVAVTVLYGNLFHHILFIYFLAYELIDVNLFPRTVIEIPP